MDDSMSLIADSSLYNVLHFLWVWKVHLPVYSKSSWLDTGWIHYFESDEKVFGDHYFDYCIACSEASQNFWCESLDNFQWSSFSRLSDSILFKCFYGVYFSRICVATYFTRSEMVQTSVQYWGEVKVKGLSRVALSSSWELDNFAFDIQQIIE